MKKPIALLLLFLCIALSGCAATVQRPATQVESLGIPVSATSSIYLHVKGAPDLAPSQDWEAFRGEWRAAMAADAAAAGRQFVYLDTVPASFDQAGTLVVVEINDYRYLSTGARYGFGVMTGNAYIDAEAEYYVLPGKRLVGSRDYATSSSAWQGVFSAMTSKQVAAITAQMLQEIDSR